MVSIDPHLYDTEPELRSNLELFSRAHLVEVRVQRSDEAAVGWREPLAALFIDGADDLASVMRDYEDWSPHVQPGGFVLIHDSTPLSKFPGPAFVAELKLKVGRSSMQLATSAASVGDANQAAPSAGCRRLWAPGHWTP